MDYQNNISESEVSHEHSNTTNLEENKSQFSSDVVPNEVNRVELNQDNKNSEEVEWVDVLGSGHLLKKVLRPAENSFKPQQSHICSLNLKGVLEDGTVVEEFENQKFQVGDAELVHGLDLILPLMEVGEVSQIKVGPRFAYGTVGIPPLVGPNATITYTLELLTSEECPEVEDIPIKTRLSIGNIKKTRGNWWFGRQENNFAIRCYRRALDYLDDIGAPVDCNGEDEANKEMERDINELLEERLKVYNNLAAAQMKIKAFDSALNSVDTVLRCQPNNVKALFRKGKILAAQGENSKAVEVLRSAFQLEPDSTIIKQELNRLQALHQRDTKKVTNMYKKMMGQEKPAKPASPSKSRTVPITWALVFGSVAAMAAGIVAYRTKFL